jgi:peroxiredoxin
VHNSGKSKILLLMLLICLVLGAGKCALAGDMILNDLYGQPVNIASYQGKPVVLFFWTTWCPYCRAELKILNQQSVSMAKEGIIVIGIDVNEPDYKVRRFFEGYQLNLKILIDKTGSLSDKYGLLGVPTYVFLDKTGKEITQAHNLPVDYKSLLFK